MVLEPARPNTPTPSTQSFITPTATVKSGPSIKNLINDPVPPASAAPENTVSPQESVQATENVSTAAIPSSMPEEVVVQPALEETVAPPAQEEPVPQPAPVETDTQAPPQETEAIKSEEPAKTNEESGPDSEEDSLPPHDVVVNVTKGERSVSDFDVDSEEFQSFWETMVDAIFADIPTLHEPLKHYHPERKGNILIIPVRNDIQENDFAPRKHQVLAYLRQNWDEKLDDIEVKLDISTETKKYILDDNDKLNALREQNPDIADFIKFLNLRIKH